jgi:hypothetical protein
MITIFSNLITHTTYYIGYILHHVYTHTHTHIYTAYSTNKPLHVCWEHLVQYQIKPLSRITNGQLSFPSQNKPSIQPMKGERCCSRGTASQDGRFRVRFPAGPWRFSSDLVLQSALCIPGVHSSSNRNEYRPASEADSSPTVLVVPYVTGRMETENSSPRLGPHDLLRKSHTLFN